jgi:predicted glycosyltransferase
MTANLIQINDAIDELRLLFQTKSYLGKSGFEAAIIYGEAIVSKIPGNRAALDPEKGIRK